MKINDMISVLQAAKEGKPIQRVKYPGDWVDFKLDGCVTEWDFYRWNYRVKPEPPKPREFWVRLCGGAIPETNAIFDSSVEALRYARGCLLDGVIHVREVLDAPSVSNGNEYS
jgi:hypothetical protein